MKIKSNKNEEYHIMQRRISIISLLSELPNFVMSVILAFATKTMLVWIDTLLSFSNIIHPLLVIVVLSSLIRDSQDTKYNYGTSRIESFTAFGCNIMIVFGLIGLGAISVINILKPTQSEHIGWFVLLKILNVSIDIYLLVKQIRLNNKQSSGINAVEITNYIMNTVSDGIVLFCSVLCFIFRNSVLGIYLSPIMSIIICVYFIIVCLRQMMDSVAELTDKSERLLEQDRIYDIILEDYSLLKSLNSVNMHRLGGAVHVDIYVDFKESVSVEDAKMWLDGIEKKIQAGNDECYHASLILENRKENS